MLYELFYSEGLPRWDLPGIGLLQYISFRSVAATVLAFVLCLIGGRVLIPRLRDAGIGEDTSKTDSARLAELHADRKNTPTMGGLFLVGSLLISGALLMRMDGINRFSAAALGLVAWFGVVGFIDDWIKLRRPEAKGLSKRAKQGLLSLGALAMGLYLLAQGLEGGRGPFLYLPFMAESALDLGLWWGLPFLLLTLLVLTGSSNAVNLTDGLDGLAIGCVISAGMAYAGICYFVGNANLSDYLLVEHIPGCGEMTVLLGALLGSSLGFLWFNASPAQVFMGDVGSLPLGGTLGLVAVVSRTELVLLVVGGVFVVEALSVIIQVASFKLRGRRVFRCAPIHHHFQFAGVPETRLVIRTWVISALLALGSLALFKLR